jgi:hypothetical protein
MTDKSIPDRFPKVGSAYERAEDDAGNYVVDPDGGFCGVQDGYEWVFDEAERVECVEKLDGTNMAVYIEHKHGEWSVTTVATRMGNKSMNQVHPFGPKTNHHYLSRAVQNSLRRGYIQMMGNEFGEGWFFGEAVGPKFQGNPHELDEQLFVPFDWLRDKCQYESYGKYDTDIESIRDWFRGEENGLFSLFASRMHGQDLESSRPDNGTFCEGVIIVHPEHDGRIHPRHMTTTDGTANQIAKLRRDMYSGHATDEWPESDYGHN